MPAPNLDFDFYAGGIEDGILEVLTTAMRQPLGVRSFGTYSGQLDSPQDLKRAVSSQSLQYPFVMASYAGGENKPMPGTSPVMGRPLHYRHSCSYAVILADNNPQGEKQRRRSKVYPMIAAVWRELTGLRLKKVVEGVEEPILLNTLILEPVENIQIMMPDITAYGVVIETAFDWISPDRSNAGTPVTEIIVGMDASSGVNFGGS
jgi:hypothetical protein